MEKKRSKFLLTMNGNNRVAKILIEKVSRLEEAQASLSLMPKMAKKSKTVLLPFMLLVVRSCS